ncbi:hypothetical protein CFC21_061542 [Triticum aestivum]|uniref:Tetratricopeptide SHNi-TPR domain-containing protein n=2 Tax=Triticum aestivum TaxID=4565 RepID=A0A9R1GVM8_WHEAT|nr:hypothetical protein CFC21_029675 [Triticum aestivum]KAF7053685.1 hypothetical protein CFC21_061542 [Triticum aestivum]
MDSSSDNFVAPVDERQDPPLPNPSEEEAGGEEKERGEEKTLERAEELFDKGSKAIEEGDFVVAVDRLSRALEIRVERYGELASECASTYYKYGCALLYKSQEETDPLGNVPKSAPDEEPAKSTTNKDSGNSKASSSNVKDDDPSSDKGGLEGQNSNEKDQEDVDGESDKDGDEMGGEEDDSDLDLAWKMLDIARAIVEKNPDNTMEKVKIFSALAEVSMEREDIDNSLGDYFKALAILEHLVEPDHRRIVELARHFRICLVYELASKIADAIPYCAKAVSLCKSRLESLKKAKATLLADKGDSASTADGDSKKLSIEDELEVVTGILPDLEKKLEDLEQAMATPSSEIEEIMKSIAAKAGFMQKAGNAVAPRAASLTSSQMGGVNNGFDSPTMSTAATSGSTGSTVTDLGVVGRGIKRANIKPISAEPCSKRLAADDSPSVKCDSSNNSDVLPTAQDGEGSVSK